MTIKTLLFSHRPEAGILQTTQIAGALRNHPSFASHFPSHRANEKECAYSVFNTVSHVEKCDEESKFAALVVFKGIWSITFLSNSSPIAPFKFFFECISHFLNKRKSPRLRTGFVLLPLVPHTWVIHSPVFCTGTYCSCRANS